VSKLQDVLLLKMTYYCLCQWRPSHGGKWSRNLHHSHFRKEI